MSGPVIVDDAGLFIDGLEGFPGPYSSFVENTLGIERVCELAQDIDSAQASFRCVLAYCDGKPFETSSNPVDRDERAEAAASHAVSEEADQDQEDTSLPVKLFAGAVPGTIVAPRGDGGFGYDPIFEHDGETLAEMSTEQKNSLSHRGRALSKFAEWYSQRD
jgi:Xanthosine triphosphate pyrophosphatase